MKGMLLLIIAILQAPAVVGFPVNPSFTTEAVEEYKVKADGGDAQAQYLYSHALANGLGIETDRPMAFLYAKRATDQGYERALWRVGRGYEYGWGGETNVVKAAACYSRFVAWAAKDDMRSDAHAQYALGMCQEYGKGVETNMAEAVQCYLRSSRLGYFPAQWHLSCLYANGEGVETNMTEAVKWCRRAAESGMACAQRVLAACYMDGDGVEKNLTESVSWYRKAADQGDIPAQMRLGLCYEHGEGVETNMVEAVKWYSKAAEQGDAHAQWHMGLCYEYGKCGEPNMAEAMKWFRKSAEHDSPPVQFWLGERYANGDGVEVNRTEAVRWFRKAAEGGHPDAQWLLGWFLLTGKGVEKNVADAVEWLHKAAVQGVEVAQVVLGGCYANGIGIGKSRSDAERWYGKAAHGNAAAEFLAAHYRSLNLLFVLSCACAFGIRMILVGYLPLRVWCLLRSEKTASCRFCRSVRWLLYALVAGMPAGLFSFFWGMSLICEDFYKWNAVVVPHEVIAGVLVWGCLIFVGSVYCLIRELMWRHRERSGKLTVTVPTYGQYVKIFMAELTFIASTLLPVFVAPLLLLHDLGWFGACVAAGISLTLAFALVCAHEYPTRRKYSKLMGMENRCGAFSKCEQCGRNKDA